MNNALFIPEKIKIGFQERSDTYTKKLAYIVYYDQKGVLRKEASWESWRDKKIDPIEFENVPTEGFVLNRGVGGVRQSYSWNVRNEYVRVYDPRNWEFEISVSNLLFILRECDCSKGKGLEGKFVYAWDKTELVLLPEISSDYQNSKNYTDLQSYSVKAKELINGASYITKKQEILIYLGRMDYYWIQDYYYHSENNKANVNEKRHIFWNNNKFIALKSLKSISKIYSESISPDYAELIDKYNKSENGSKIIKIYAKKDDIKIFKKHKMESYYNWYWVLEKNEKEFLFMSSDSLHKNQVNYINYLKIITFENGELFYRNYSERTFRVKNPNIESSKNNYYYADADKSFWVEPNGMHLYAELESGEEFLLLFTTMYKN